MVRHNQEIYARLPFRKLPSLNHVINKLPMLYSRKKKEIKIISHFSNLKKKNVFI